LDSEAHHDESIAKPKLEDIAMIRLIYLLRRKAGMTHEDFQNYWLNEHGPKVQKVAEALGIRRYIQSHSIQPPEAAQPDQYRGDMQQPFDGVAEFWFDSMDALMATNEHREVIDAELVADEAKFIQHSESAGWIAYDCPQINPTPANVIAAPESNIVKLFYALNQPTNAEIEATQWYWRVQHGPLVREAIQALKYIQVHRLQHEFNAGFAASRGTLDSYYGHAELWFDLDRAPHAGRESAAKLLYEDETHFIDFSQSASWLNKEHVLVDTLEI
jgi:hypothetical protein